MIKVQVKLTNDIDTKYDEIEITKEEIKQLACDKAKQMYTHNYYNRIEAYNDLTLSTNL